MESYQGHRRSNVVNQRWRGVTTNEQKIADNIKTLFIEKIEKLKDAMNFSIL